MKDLLSKFIKYNPLFIDSLNEFDELTRKKLLKKLKLEKDIQNFRSTIAEIQFGKLFSYLEFQFEYDKKYLNGQTPDWTIMENRSSAIVEVYRLGESATAQAKSDFENEILMAINRIQKPYLIQLLFTDSNFSALDYNLSEITSRTVKWVSSERQINDEITLQNIVKLKVLSNQTKYDHACFVGSSSSIDFKPGKLKQPQKLNPNEITKKLKKYQPLITTINVPYFLAVSIDFTSGFDFDDFIQYFLGTDVYNADYGIEIKEYPEYKMWGKNWTELGLFYEAPTLSGLILRYNNEHKLILNPQRSQNIYDEKNEAILNKLKLINK